MTAVKSIRDAVDDIITALEEVGIHGVWAVFAEPPDVVVVRKEGGYEVMLFGKFVHITVATDEEFNVKNVEVEVT